MAKEKAVDPSTENTLPKGRQHKATYARDKKNPGSFLVRITGPHAKEFEGREVPVMKNGGGEQLETLSRAVFSGTDEGKITPADKGQTYCLYEMVRHPKEYVQPEF